MPGGAVREAAGSRSMKEGSWLRSAEAFCGRSTRRALSGSAMKTLRSRLATKRFWRSLYRSWPKNCSIATMPIGPCLVRSVLTERSRPSSVFLHEAKGRCVSASPFFSWYLFCFQVAILPSYPRILHKCEEKRIGPIGCRKKFKKNAPAISAVCRKNACMHHKKLYMTWEYS